MKRPPLPRLSAKPRQQPAVISLRDEIAELREFLITAEACDGIDDIYDYLLEH